MNLDEAVGRYVRVKKEEGRLRGHFCGTLETPDEEGIFLVRISNDPRGHGENYIGFTAEAVFSVCRNLSGIIDIVI